MNTLNEDWENAVIHYGKKGMKWGVRTKRGGLLGDATRKIRNSKLNQARLKSAARSRELEDAWVSNIKKQKTIGGKTRAYLLGELDSSKAKRSKVDIHIYDNDPPKVKAGKVAVQAAIGVAMVVAFSKIG